MEDGSSVCSGTPSVFVGKTGTIVPGVWLWMCGLSASSASHMLLRRDLYTIAAHEVLQIPEGTTRELENETIHVRG